MTGRCWFEPIRVGTRFTVLASVATTASTRACELEVSVIEAYGQLMDELGQTVTARLTLTGTAELAAGAYEETLLLVADPPSDPTWTWNGELWARDSPAPLY